MNLEEMMGATSLFFVLYALTMPATLLPYPKPDEITDAARNLAAQRDFVVADSTRAKNRLRAILFESCSAFELDDEISCLLTATGIGTRTASGPVIDTSISLG